MAPAGCDYGGRCDLMHEMEVTMSDTLSNKKEIVKNSSVNKNPRPIRPQPSFAETMRLASCDPEPWLPGLLHSTENSNGSGVPDEHPAERNPRPSRSEPRFTEVCDPKCEREEDAKCDNILRSPAEESRNASDTEVERRKYPPGIRKLQQWIGVRGGVSPKLRKICGSGDEALILNQLVCYWFGRERKRNRIRARVLRVRHRWVAKSFKEWAVELGMTEKQARRCIAALAGKELIVVRTWRFQGHNTTHVRLLVGNIAEAAGYQGADEEL